MYELSSEILFGSSILRSVAIDPCCFDSTEHEKIESVLTRQLCDVLLTETVII